MADLLTFSVISCYIDLHVTFRSWFNVAAAFHNATDAFALLFNLDHFVVLGNNGTAAVQMIFKIN